MTGNPMPSTSPTKAPTWALNASCSSWAFWSVSIICLTSGFESAAMRPATGDEPIVMFMVSSRLKCFMGSMHLNARGKTLVRKQPLKLSASSCSSSSSSSSNSMN